MQRTFPAAREALPGRAGLLWLAQALSGLLLVFLLGLHMVANHFALPQGLANYRDVIDYLSNPLIFVLETAFLIVVAAHALLGVRAMLIDAGLSARAQRAVDVVLAVLWLLMAAYGLWLTITIVNR
jgi:succinate dehydrogenase hydrophobic anchor subunit